MSAARLAKGALKIPKYIERGPTDILKALASTVKFIPDQPEYVLQDDPYLLPVRPIEYKIYVLSKLSGIKTAKFLLNKHPELFFRDDAEPKVEDFAPGEKFDSSMEFTEEDVQWCIENKDPVNGIIAYNLLEAKGVKLSDETIMQFLELLCYTNEESLLDFYDYEKSRLQPQSEESLMNYTWKTSGLASKIFNKIKEDLDSPRVYSVMIAGLSKYNEHSTAQQVFEDFKQNHPDKGLYKEAYNGLLCSVQRLHSSTTTVHEAVDDIVKHMSDHLVSPNLTIFNSILKTYRFFGCNETTCEKTFAIFNDMQTLNIEPSLSSYTSLIRIIAKFRGGQTYGDLISDILSYIEHNDHVFEVKDDRDREFYANTINSVGKIMHNVNLCHKVHKIYQKQPNLIGGKKHKANYLNDYFKIIVTTSSLEDIMKFYNDYIPTQFEPSPDSYEALAEVLDLYQADEDIIKKIGKDLIQFKLADKIKNDSIFRKDPSYVKALEKSI